MLLYICTQFEINVLSSTYYLVYICINSTSSYMYFKHFASGGRTYSNLFLFLFVGAVFATKNLIHN